MPFIPRVVGSFGCKVWGGRGAPYTVLAPTRRPCGLSSFFPVSALAVSSVWFQSFSRNVVGPVS